jgi:predicted lipid-binding transport protein (Tim44 family)
MNKVWAALIILFAFSFNVTEVHAKKFGGGKSYGKLFKTSPAPKKPNQFDSNQQKQAAPANNAAKSSSKKGMMGGLLGGLLAGGLIGAMLGGAFEGVQFMDILIIALIAFVAYRLFKGMASSKASAMNRQAYATGGNSPAFSPKETPNSNFGSSTPQFGGADGVAKNEPEQDEVPFDLPPNFDLNGFLAGACDHYRKLQDAWNTSDYSIIEEYTSPELGQQLIQERQALEGEQHTEVMFVDAELVRAHQVFGTAQVSIKFSGRYKDASEGVEEDITDIWHLERNLTKPDAPWYIIGIE